MRSMTDFMCELENILRLHAARYPQMEPQDAVKLIWQNEFGCGHLIRDVESCMRMLRREYETLPPNAAKLPPEPIGNGLVRVYLGAVPPEKLDVLGQVFVRSAELSGGGGATLSQKLELLRRLTEQGSMCFSTTALEAYLEPYVAAGCPMVSHSPTYRAAYAPAYRVICRELAGPFMENPCMEHG